jgi:flagella basal body P-ring formation protein FlgA
VEPTLVRHLGLALALLAGRLLAGGPAAAASAPGLAPDPALAGAVEVAAARAAEDQVVAPDRFEVLDVRFAGADPRPAGRPRLEPLEIHGPNASGVVQVLFRVVVDGQACGRARATVRGLVRGPVLQATRTLRAGEPIPAGAVAPAEADLTRIADTVLRDERELAGRVPVRSLGAGRVLTAELLRPAAIVRRGDLVEATVRRGALVATLRATALQDGAAGQVVAVENTSTGAELLAEVQPDGSVSVVRGARRGSRR